MPWPLREVRDADEHYEILRREGLAATIGLYWKVKHREGEGKPFVDHVIVVLPPGGNRGWFMPYRNYNGNTWSISGEWPNVTITPSVNCPGSYHGYIRDGMVTDDVDGRKY